MCWNMLMWENTYKTLRNTVYPKKYAHGFVVLYFVVVMQSFIMNSHEVFIHIHQGCFAGTGAIVRLPQCQWSKPDGYGKISQCINTTKHSQAKTMCIFLGIYCTCGWLLNDNYMGSLGLTWFCRKYSVVATYWCTFKLTQHYSHANNTIIWLFLCGALLNANSINFHGSSFCDMNSITR